VRALLGSMNPGLPILSASTLEDSVALGLAPQRIAASVAGSLGLVGLVLAAIGIYGATSFSVARRMREIGIRTALGARRTDVVAMVVREGLALTVAGSLLGLLAASAMGRIVSAFLFGTSPIDPVAFGGVAALFVAVSLLAAAGPVRQATSRDAILALRRE
jgi:putative ABC transport system permease protein